MKSKLILIALVGFMTACAATGGKSDVCAGWKPILLTGAAIDALSVQEATDILAHNEFGRARGCWVPA